MAKGALIRRSPQDLANERADQRETAAEGQNEPRSSDGRQVWCTSWSALGGTFPAITLGGVSRWSIALSFWPTAATPLMRRLRAWRHHRAERAGGRRRWQTRRPCLPRSAPWQLGGGAGRAGARRWWILSQCSLGRQSGEPAEAVAKAQGPGEERRAGTIKRARSWHPSRPNRRRPPRQPHRTAIGSRVTISSVPASCCRLTVGPALRTAQTSPTATHAAR